MPRPKKSEINGKSKFTTALDAEIKNDMQRYCFENGMYMNELIEMMFLNLKKEEEKAKKRAERKAKKEAAAEKEA